MNRLQLALLLSSLGAAALVSSACGGISDPTKGGSEGRVATVSGALTGVSVPPNARVALVYRKVLSTGPGSASTSTVVVGSDVAVVDGKFTMNLGAPADDLFTNAENTSVGNVSTPPSTGVDNPPPPVMAGSSTSGSPGAFGASGAFGLTPRDIVGGEITQPLSAAIAGFVVYADTNGNGQLDLEGEYASSTDQILGGNKELVLVYLKGGGSLDYEKLRDKSGILPTPGFDLAWTEGRWFPLTEVELKLSSNAQLPSPVCQPSYDTVSTISDSSGTSGGSGGVSESPTTTADGGVDPGIGSGSSGSSSSGGGGGGFGSDYPSPSDPNLHCAPDGRSYTYGGGDTGCAPPPPVPQGLCSGDVSIELPCASSGGYANALSSGAPVPPGWPCPTDLDGGAADASVDGGSGDGGSAVDAGSFDGG
jgi:hypothetical protein